MIKKSPVSSVLRETSFGSFGVSEKKAQPLKIYFKYFFFFNWIFKDSSFVTADTFLIINPPTVLSVLLRAVQMASGYLPLLPWGTVPTGKP